METHATTAPGVPAQATVPTVGERRAEVAREARLPGILRQLVTGAAAIAMLHAAVLGVFSHGRPYPDLAWTGSAEVMTSLYTLAPWPLTGSVLLWLANQRPALYARTAIALLLTGAAGLGYAGWAALGNLPGHEDRLFQEYVALPGALTGWYLLTAVAMAAAIPSVRVRIAVATTGLGAVVTSALTSGDPLRAVLFAAVVPLLTWGVAGRFPGRQAERRRRRADAWDPRGLEIVTRTRTRTRIHTRTPVRVPARRTMPSRPAG